MPADARPIGSGDGVEFARTLAQPAGIVAIPSVVFYDDKAAVAPYGPARLLQAADVIDQAVRRLAAAKLWV